MTLEEINQLTIESASAILIERIGEEATEDQLLAELDIYKQELLAELAHQEYLAEKARREDLESRFAQMSDKGILQASGIRNVALHFRDEVLMNPDKEAAEAEMIRLEEYYSSYQFALAETAWLDDRKAEYARIDDLLKEALVEKELGDSTKWDEYVALREDIKARFPKPE